MHFVCFLFNMIRWFRLQSVCKFADLLQIIAADALQIFCRYSADGLQIICGWSVDCLQISYRRACRSVADYKQICSFRTGALEWNNPCEHQSLLSRTPKMELSLLCLDWFESESGALDVVPIIAVITLYPVHNVLFVVRVNAVCRCTCVVYKIVLFMVGIGSLTVLEDFLTVFHFLAFWVDFLGLLMASFLLGIKSNKSVTLSYKEIDGWEFILLVYVLPV